MLALFGLTYVWAKIMKRDDDFKDDNIGDWTIK
jgi:hypothetical protein